MTTEELRQQYYGLYDYMANSRKSEYMKVFGKVMTEMFEWLAANKREAAEDWLEKLSAIKWGQYMTKQEAEEIVSSMRPKAPWGKDAWNNAMDAYGLQKEERPYYNCNALWVEMNKQYSDSAETIAFIMGKELGDVTQDEMVNATYRLALDALKDEDGNYQIRRYFGV